MSALLAKLSANPRKLTSPARQRRRPALRFETLDERRLLAIAVHFDDGFRSGDYHPEYHGLWINGSDKADNVEVKINNRNGLLTVYLTENNYQRRVFNIAAATVPVLYFYGAGGDDNFKSSFAGKSVVHGGAGNDTLSAGWGEVYVFGDADNDTLSAGNLAYGEFYGGPGRDFITGTAQADLIYGGDGNDVIDGQAGDDTIFGEFGHDQIFGGDGDDTLYGGEGGDRIFGNAGTDTIVGGLQDYFEVYFDNDKLYGGDGIDFLYGGPGEDLLCGCEYSAGTFVPDGNYDYLAGEQNADTFVRTYVMSDGWLTPDDEFADFSTGEKFQNFVSQNLILDFPTVSLLAEMSQTNGFALNTMSSEEELWDQFYASEAAESPSIVEESFEADEALAIDPQFTSDPGPLDQVFTNETTWTDAYTAAVASPPKISSFSKLKYFA